MCAVISYSQCDVSHVFSNIILNLHSITKKSILDNIVLIVYTYSSIFSSEARRNLNFLRCDKTKLISHMKKLQLHDYFSNKWPNHSINFGTEETTTPEYTSTTPVPTTSEFKWAYMETKKN